MKASCQPFLEWKIGDCSTIVRKDLWTEGREVRALQIHLQLMFFEEIV